MLNEYEQRV